MQHSLDAPKTFMLQWRAPERKIMIYKNIITEIGCIQPKRDAIFIDSVKQQYNSLILEGNVSSHACEERFQDCDRYFFLLEFSNLTEYSCYQIDRFYSMQIETQSVFVEVIDFQEEVNFHKYILETYDFAYIVLCRDFKFSVLGKE